MSKEQRSEAICLSPGGLMARANTENPQAGCPPWNSDLVFVGEEMPKPSSLWADAGLLSHPMLPSTHTRTHTHRCMHAHINARTPLTKL